MTQSVTQVYSEKENPSSPNIPEWLTEKNDPVSFCFIVKTMLFGGLSNGFNIRLKIQYPIVGLKFRREFIARGWQLTLEPGSVRLRLRNTIVERSVETVSTPSNVFQVQRDVEWFQS